MKANCNLQSFFRQALLAVLAVSLSGCIYEYPDEDCVDMRRVEVRFNWEKAPAASPEGMAVKFFPESGSDLWRYDLPTGGGSVNLVDGEYHVGAFSNDTHDVVFEGNAGYSTFLVTTRESALADGAGMTGYLAQPPKNIAEPVMSQPDRMWACILDSWDFSAGVDVLELCPEPIVTCCHIAVENIENIGSAAMMSMALTGLSPGYKFSEGYYTDTPVTVPGSFSKTDQTAAFGTLLTFGKIPDAANLLNIYVWLRNGEKRVFTFDVTPQMTKPTTDKQIYIRVSGVSLPAIEPGQGGGMEVGVDNWEVIYIPLHT